MNYEIRSSVKDGNLVRNRNLIKEAISTFEGKEVIIKIEKAKNKRSNPQNAFYHGVCVVIMQNALKESGHLMTLLDTHELLKLRFLKETILVDEASGEIIERVKSTKELSTTGFMEYIQDIQRFASEFFNVEIPDPSTEITLNFDK